jgi:hypothetical protein
LVASVHAEAVQAARGFLPSGVKVGDFLVELAAGVGNVLDRAQQLVQEFEYFPAVLFRDIGGIGPDRAFIAILVADNDLLDAIGVSVLVELGVFEVGLFGLFERLLGRLGDDDVPISTGRRMEADHVAFGGLELLRRGGVAARAAAKVDGFSHDISLSSCWRPPLRGLDASRPARRQARGAKGDGF